ncbi:MAG: DUF5054 domain-containing protein [Clostridia bacterium]
MRKVYLVSKTHLDLGFTDYARKIQNRYIEQFIPQAIEIARQTNVEKKKFVWATGSWILNCALAQDDKSRAQELFDAMQRGDIVAHALPFTMHTELLDEENIRYGLEINKKIDERLGKKTVWAKMTDVPGHTRSLVPLLAEYGIKLLHIGVNGASAVPKAPPVFVWKNGDSEVVVIYEGSYGGEFRCEFVDDIIYFAHTGDNRGVANYDVAMSVYDKLCKKYPDAEVVAGGLDEMAEKLWAVRDKLPIVTAEIGDTWIHGAASDPYKSAALRELLSLKREWLADGSLLRSCKQNACEQDKRKVEEYNFVSDKLLCVAEHTWGVDIKKFFGDYNNYRKINFAEAKKADRVKDHLFPLDNLLIAINRRTGAYRKGSYKAIEESWQEQREYVADCVGGMSDNHREQAEQRLALLRPIYPISVFGKQVVFDQEYSRGEITYALNKFGGLSLRCGDEQIMRSGGFLIYQSCGIIDYNFWKKNYMRDWRKTFSWANGDFLRPNARYCNLKYDQGRWVYNAAKACVSIQKDYDLVSVELTTETRLNEELGAPRKITVQYYISDKKTRCVIEWFGKDENRLTEMMFARFYPAATAETLRYTKMNREVNPYDVLENGNRNLSAVQDYHFTCGDCKVKVTPMHNPIVGLGEGKILKFDNKFENVETEGVASVLYDNVWGTNFPLWYGENAHFETDIEIEKVNKESNIEQKSKKTDK